MKVLIADDEKVSRRILEKSLTDAGYDVTVTTDGDQAWDVLNTRGSPRLAILDWMMPGMDGDEICRRLRAARNCAYTYVILVTARTSKDDIVAGLSAGADDYLAKPFNVQELLTRIQVGERVLSLETRLAGKILELKDALEQVRTLQGLIPICMHCKRIRDDADMWHGLESYISKHSGAEFTHSLCSECMKEHYPGISEPKPEESKA